MDVNKFRGVLNPLALLFQKMIVAAMLASTKKRAVQPKRGGAVLTHRKPFQPYEGEREIVGRFNAQNKPENGFKNKFKSLPIYATYYNDGKVYPYSSRRQKTRQWVRNGSPEIFA